MIERNLKKAHCQKQRAALFNGSGRAARSTANFSTTPKTLHGIIDYNFELAEKDQVVGLPRDH